MRRWLRVLARPGHGQRLIAVGLCASASAAVAEEPAPQVQFEGIALRGAARLHYLNGALELHPKAALGFGWDSNVALAADDPVSDSFTIFAVGLETRWHRSRSDRFVGDLLFKLRDYHQEDDSDLYGGQADLRYTHERAGGRIDVAGAYGRWDDPLPETGRAQRHQYFNGSLRGRLLGKRDEFGLELFARRDAYLEAGFSDAAGERDHIDYGVRSRWDHRFARLRPAALELVVRHRLYDEADAPYQDGWVGTLGAEYRWPLGENTGIELSAGLTGRFHEDDYAGQDGYYDQTMIGPNVEVAWAWRDEPVGHLGVALFSRLGDSDTANAARISALRVDLGRDLNRRWAIAAKAGLSHRRDSGAPVGRKERTTTTLALGARMAFRLRRGFDARLGAEWRDHDSEYDADTYERVLLRMSAVVAF
ncbi:MAG: hypothetical protein ACOCYV_00730 [Planctomycetota bacterium]